MPSLSFILLTVLSFSAANVFFLCLFLAAICNGQMDQRNFWKGNYRLPGNLRGMLCFEVIKVMSYIFAVDTF